MEKLKMHTPDLTEANIQRIREVFPSCITETKDAKGNVKLAVDFDQLRQELSDSIVEGPQERYHLNWPGKREALLTANAPIAKTLRPCREESVDFDTTKNLFIEGDNLEALKLLQETYLGKVKMIYIDPPYNTGNDFIYDDDFSENAEDFFIKSNQKDSSGNNLIANKDSNGRFHSDWLSMMYPRIKLSRNLLSDDGLLFISIDDNEVASLCKICDEIFGDKNFVGSISWLKKRKGSFLSKKIVSVTEWLLVYSKTNEIKLFGGKADETESQPLIKKTNAKSQLKIPVKAVSTKLADGVYKAGKYGTGKSSVDLLDDLTIIDGKNANEFRLSAPFVWSQSNLDNQLKSGGSLIINTLNFQLRAFKAPSDDAFKGILSVINGVELAATNEDGYEELTDILGSEGIMDYPKPKNYIKHLISAATHWHKEAIVMDFFAGSASTAHATLQLNADDGGARKFIMVQIPEECDLESEAFAAGYKTIAEISKERIRRAGKKILEGECNDHWNKDVGFRVLKIDTSNMAEVYYTPDGVKQDDLLAAVDNIKPDRKPEDLLFQVLLDWGVDLSLPITKQTIQDKTVFFVDGNALVACFDNGISEELVKELAGGNPLRVVFRDNGFVSDSVKINAEQIFKQMSPGTDVKSI